MGSRVGNGRLRAAASIAGVDVLVDPRITSQIAAIVLVRCIGGNG